MAQLGERIKIALGHKGMTQAELARSLGVKGQTISYLCADDSRAVSSRYSARIAEILGVNPQWLMDGIGDMHDPMVRIEVEGKSFRLNRIPLVADRYPIPEGESPVSLMSSVRMSRRAFAFTVNDTAMQPIINPSDQVIVDPEVIPVPGDLVAAEQNGHLLVRRYRQKEEDGFELIAANPDWPTLSSKTTSLCGTIMEHRAYRRVHHGSA